MSTQFTFGSALGSSSHEIFSVSSSGELKVSTKEFIEMDDLMKILTSSDSDLALYLVSPDEKERRIAQEIVKLKSVEEAKK